MVHGQVTKEPCRFEHVAYDEEAQGKQASLKAKVKELEGLINGNLGRGRAQSLALTKLEEVYMWIGKAIRDDQVAR